MNRLFILLAIICLGAIFSSYNEKIDIAEKGNKEKFKLLTMPILSPDKIIEVDRGNNNTTVCQEGKIILRPKSIDPEELYEWKDETGNVIAIGTECIINNLDTTRTYTLTIFKSDNTERVVNGGFEADARDCLNTVPYNYTTEENVGPWWKPKWETHYWTFDFSSDYGWAGTGSSALNPEGKYTIGSKPHDYHSNFADKEAKSGIKMLIANGSSNPTSRVWYQRISVQKNTKYAFSLWGMSVDKNYDGDGIIYSKYPAELSFFVRDNKLTEAQIRQSPSPYRIGDPFILPTNTAVWEKFYKIWDSKDFQGEKWISIINSVTALGGNDFALDDISFTGTLYETCTIRVEVEPRITGDESETIFSVCEGSLSRDKNKSQHRPFWETEK